MCNFGPGPCSPWALAHVVAAFFNRPAARRRRLVLGMRTRPSPRPQPPPPRASRRPSLRAAAAAVLTSLPVRGSSASPAPCPAVVPQIRWNEDPHPGAELGMSSSSVARSEAGEFTEVVVVRHGETAWNASRIIQVVCCAVSAPSPISFLPLKLGLCNSNFGGIIRWGNWKKLNLGHLDVELNEIGRQQAVAVARRLSNEVKPAAIYSSDLKRAAETAEIIAKACNLPNVVFDPALRERHIGDLQGLKYENAGTEKPEAYKAFMSHKRNRQIPGGGESLDQLSERCVSCLYNIVEKHQGERVILVSHGGTIRELYRHASPMKPLHGKIHNTSVSVILVSGATGRCIVKACGDISHLKETSILENAFGGDKHSA
uniref:Phosphoglycerate mutase (2,3-diphosphoglycerate-dependent) n=1 Tax=Leersia perrieri TaxID=77586 RepID=A0A0D9X8W3_9ORYZ